MDKVGGGGINKEVEDGGHTEDTRQRVHVLAVVVTVLVEVVRGKKILGFLTLKGEGVRLGDWEHSGRTRRGKTWHQLQPWLIQTVSDSQDSQ